MFSSLQNIFLAALVAASSVTVIVSTVAAQDGPLVWQFREMADDSNPGSKMATLVYGVPETDNVQISGDCRQADAGEDALANVILGADIGSKLENDWVDVEFSSGSFRETLKGSVYGTKQEEGVTGALIKLGFEDPLWTTLQEKADIDYRISGQAPSNLPLKGGHSTIRRFVTNCKSYSSSVAATSRRPASGTVAMLAARPTSKPAPKAETETETAADSAAAPAKVSEKEAYESAKELGTLEAWEAFLTRFPTGFRADLARAYVRKIGIAPSGTAPPETSNPDPEPVPAVPEQPAELLPTVEVGPGSKSWAATRYSMDEGNASADAAAVQTDGVELLFFCNSQKRLSGILREESRGVYPDFDTRIAQGLAERRRRGEDQQNAFIRMQFSNDKIYSVSAAVQELTGEVSLGYLTDGGGFDPSGDLVSDLMGSRTVKISAPPFGATFQLSNSRKALCKALDRCGAESPHC